MRIRRPWRLVAALLATLLCIPITPASAQPDRYATIDAYVRDRMEATSAPGLAYAVVGPGGPIHQRAWGTDGHDERVTAETPFLWGSVAKPVTATAVMTLVQSGRLGLDDRVVDHLPRFRFGGSAHASEVTIRHLLGQTAGIPAAATFKVTDCHGSGCPRPAERLDALNDVTPLGPPGTEYAYSSANYLALSAVAESVTGRPFADHLRRTVLGPAGMDGAIADAASARKRNLPPGHQLLWGFPAATSDGYDDHGAAYGYLGGDLNDLAAFAALQLRAGKGAGTVLTDESVRLMRQEGSAGGSGTGYGLGWRVGGLEAPLDDAIWHTGGTPGYSAMLFLLPRQNVALVLHQNLYGLMQDKAVMQAGFGAALLLAGGEPAAAPSASVHHLTVWGLTALAAVLLLAAGRSALLLRRPAVPATRRRLVTVTSAWVAIGALPGVAAMTQSGQIRPLMIWVPDAFAAVCAAAVAGAATALLRLVLAVRTHRHSLSPRTSGASEGIKRGERARGR
ncbi:serine hydrolase domain-containing protein [Actinomadura sp. 7K507]|uniref:serine hydrolase domain-containing protein n=1 Tax=Actinomadura sp. 7K507 TaxID=2530365 RepID=UPI0010437FF4|nr:serine hydrolase domain-containing protein [Actinomadura sp. 7K507]TDC93056.1 class A beta-lactamase-related serine hydrolase [Actinomadura sp. 7K507]